MRAADRWTPPFYGVQHMRDVPRSHQITLEDHDTFVRVYCLALHSSHPFTPVEEHDAPTVVRAQQIGERMRCLLGA